MHFHTIPTINYSPKMDKKIIKAPGTNKQEFLSSPGDTTIKNVSNNILSQTTKLEQAQYSHAALFSPTTTSLLKAINIGFLKNWPVLTYALIKNHLEK